jgi:hypothetical protein
MPWAVTTWIVRFVDRTGVLRVRTFHTEQGACSSMGQLRADPTQEFRS